MMAENDQLTRCDAALWQDLIAIVEEKANRRKREELRMHHNALRKEVQADTEVMLLTRTHTCTNGNALSLSLCECVFNLGV
jgi:hypothetical protein